MQEEVPSSAGEFRHRSASTDGSPTRRAKGSEEVSESTIDEVEKKYFSGDSARPAGKHTEFIRIAFSKVRRRERRRFRIILGAAFLCLVVVGGVAIQKAREVKELERQIAQIFQSTKALEVQLVNLRISQEEGTLQDPGEISRLESERSERLAQYDELVLDRGFYRRVETREEELIYRTARRFGESEFAVSGDFVEAVSAVIHGHWLSRSGRIRFRSAILRAERNGYTERIVQTLRRRGVSPEFFYLALQESEFSVDAVGPWTRYGYAKGMWQFIPGTGERFGLRSGPLMEQDVPDPEDDRHDFERSTDAAARYLRFLHGELTQASGLLVMAAYNWGEHRVGPRLEQLERPSDPELFRQDFEGVPLSPEHRNYWTFLETYRDRMPDQTKDYVLLIFAAAVIGSDPGEFDFDFENPLAGHLF
jgi:soluble lytic murein transglycosylase-like protein